MLFSDLQAIALAGSIPREILREDQTVLQNSALFTPYVVVAGTLVSVGSSTLGNLYGASKILQAMAQDEISWLLSPFMTKKAVPRMAIGMTWVIAQVRASGVLGPTAFISQNSIDDFLKASGAAMSGCNSSLNRECLSAKKGFNASLPFSLS